MTMTDQERIAARRARVAQFHKEGRVMNDSLRRRQKEAVKRQQKLEEMADTVLAGMNPHSKPHKNVVVHVNNKTNPDEANVFLPRSKKSDDLAAAANKILEELLK